MSNLKNISKEGVLFVAGVVAVTLSLVAIPMVHATSESVTQTTTCHNGSCNSVVNANGQVLQSSSGIVHTTCLNGVCVTKFG
jgi:hypothetical protein